MTTLRMRRGSAAAEILVRAPALMTGRGMACGSDRKLEAEARKRG
jgi:hypothetical protein